MWGPFLLALALGLVVSAGLYFAYLWPQVEPDDDGEKLGQADTRFWQGRHPQLFDAAEEALAEVAAFLTAHT